MASPLTTLTKKLSQEAIDAFEKLGDAQRGRPEQQMLNTQSVNSGVLNPVVEHTGDLTHRMSHMAKFDNFLPEIIQEKVTKMLNALEHPYGFEREMGENLRANAKHIAENPQYASPNQLDPDLGTPLGENSLSNLLDKELSKYAEEHRKLPAYNRAQWHGREAAIAVGDKRFSKATKHLKSIQALLDSGEYNRVARGYHTNQPAITRRESIDRAMSRIDNPRQHLPEYPERAEHKDTSQMSEMEAILYRLGIE